MCSASASLALLDIWTRVSKIVPLYTYCQCGTLKYLSADSQQGTFMPQEIYSNNYERERNIQYQLRRNAEGWKQCPEICML
jgi:hypothetical protein